MRLRPACPQCGSALTGELACPLHGAVQPCWRAVEASYDAFAEHLVLSRGLPTWLPWPLPPGWGVTLTVVTEEPRVGLGAHLADVPHGDPGRAAWDQPPALRLRVGGASVPLWPVPVPRTGGDGDGDGDERTVLAGEAQGRWLWVVVSPAEAVLGLVDRASLGDAAGLGPELLAVAFGKDASGG